MESINIIGCGRAAGSLAQLWLQAGSVRIGGILNRSETSTREAVRDLGSGDAMLSMADFEPARYWLIGTSDEEIEPVAQNLGEAGVDLQGSTVFHLCGRYGPDILASLADRGCGVAAVHPVRSLTNKRISLMNFEGTACVAEGRADVLEDLNPLFRGIGGGWIPVQNLDRGLYHAAVSIISNITKAVAWKAQNWLVDSGLNQEMAADVTHKLLSSTLEDVARTGARQSITGPVVRGDTSTIEAHIQALQKGHRDDIELYRVLARTVLELASERGDLDAGTLRRFKVILGSLPTVSGEYGSGAHEK